MNLRERKLHGFTLIELLVVIAIIGILATVSIVALNNARAKSRDAKRLADVKNIQTALAMYYTDKGQYPMTLISGQALYSTSLDASSNVVTTTYISNIPTIPTPADGANCNTANNTLNYATSSDLQTYTLSTCISSPPQTAASSSGAAIYIADPTQSQPCGQYVIDYAGQKYRTIQIGTQCWMRDNLNVGTMIDGAVASTNNGILEKYCYNNVASNCATSALYQWNEAVGYSTSSGAQGICPPGWHVPADSEANILDQSLTDSGGTCDSSRHAVWDCATAGTKLKIGGSTGFDVQMTGYMNENTNFFSGSGSQGYLWSSDGSGSYAFYRRIDTSLSTVYRRWSTATYGHGVRCLKN